MNNVISCMICSQITNDIALCMCIVYVVVLQRGIRCRVLNIIYFNSAHMTRFNTELDVHISSPAVYNMMQCNGDRIKLGL